MLKAISVGSVSIFPNIYLSSMHGITDYAFRRLISNLSNHKTGLLTSEFTSAQELHLKNKRALQQLKFIEEQGKLLNKVADLIDLGYVQTTVGKYLGVINAENLKLAHEALESGQSIGKIVLEGF